jgi:hypothetical protein
MKTIETPIVVYQAYDGTEFSTEDECKKYENSATTVLISKLSDCVIGEPSDTGWFDLSEDNDYKTLVPTTLFQINVMNQLYFMYEGKGRMEPKFTKDDINKIVLLGYRYYGPDPDWVWFYKFDDIVSTITEGKYKLTAL